VAVVDFRLRDWLETVVRAKEMDRRLKHSYLLERDSDRPAR
jgi:hypothetical protein